MTDNAKKSQSAVACMIWMHGLGADSQDMKSLVAQLPVNFALHHVFLDAPVRPVTINNGIPMRAWYDITGIKFTDREDEEGILQSTDIILASVQQQLKAGFRPEQIFLAGFSQGGAMALFAGLHTDIALGGILALSGYLPLARRNTWNQAKAIPIFMAAGQYDQIVLPAWTQESVNCLQQADFNNVFLKVYPMEHSICFEEVGDMAGWVSANIKTTAISSGGKA